MSDRIVRDGKVAVLISGSFGAGWSTWNTDCEALLFDPQIVEAIERGDKAAALLRAEALCPDGYLGGLDGLSVEWLPLGAKFIVHEYDGSESIWAADDIKWHVA